MITHKRQNFHANCAHNFTYYCGGMPFSEYQFIFFLVWYHIKFQWIKSSQLRKPYVRKIQNPLGKSPTQVKL